MSRKGVSHSHIDNIPHSALSAGRLRDNRDYQPLDTADTQEARNRNRRIELKLTER